MADETDRAQRMADQIDAALAAFWRGSAVEFDSLISQIEGTPTTSNIFERLLQLRLAVEDLHRPADNGGDPKPDS